MKLILTLLSLITFISQASYADDKAVYFSDCDGIIITSEQTTIPNPLSKDVICYPAKKVPDSRLAALLVAKTYVESIYGEVSFLVVPIQTHEKDNTVVNAWEVRIISHKLNRLVSEKVVNANTMEVRTICDDQEESNSCLKRIKSIN